MPPVGHQERGEKMWWWKVAQHLDEAQRALANATAHNVDDPRLAHELHDRLRGGQAILLEIFRAKGLLPATNGKAPAPTPPTPPAPVTVMPPQQPETVNGEAASVAPPAEIVAEEPAVSGADHDAEAEAVAPPPEAVVSVPVDALRMPTDAGDEDA